MATPVRAYEAGSAKAKEDIASGHLRFFSGAPSHGWGRDLADTLQTLFAVEVDFTSCLVTPESVAFEEGYNDEATKHMNRTFGDGSLATALDEVQQRRKRAYDDWVASEGLT